MATWYEKYKVNIPPCKNGEWEVDTFTTPQKYVDYSGIRTGRTVPAGETFTRLRKNNMLIMSDTPAEIGDHMEFIENVSGNVLIAGLGFGMCLKAIIDKVDHVTVVEISQELIDMISPHYSSEKITYVCADIFEFKPEKGTKYDFCWIDIWNVISPENIVEMDTIKKKMNKYSKNISFWCRRQCIGLRRQENKFSFY